jgi:hypothetical protein
MAGKVVAHLVSNGARCILLGHLSHENNFPELAWQTAANALAEKNLIPGDGFHLEVARRDRTSSIVWAEGDRIWCEPAPSAGMLPEQIGLLEQIGLPELNPRLDLSGLPGSRGLPAPGLTGLDAADDWLTIRVAEKD